MKTRIILIALMALLVSPFSNLSAQNSNADYCNISKFTQVQISYNNNDTVTIEYLDALAEAPRKMKVRIYNESGKLLYNRSMREKGHSRVGYDISDLPAGNYTIELYKKKDLLCSKAIAKQESNRIYQSEEKFDINKLKQVELTNKNEDMVHLEYIDILSEGKRKVNVRIYDMQGELFYDKYIIRTGDIRLNFDISQLPYGSYNFELLRDQKLVYEEVFVKEKRATVKPVLLANENTSK